MTAVTTDHQSAAITLASWTELRPIPDAGRARVRWLLVNRRDGVCLGLTMAEAAAVRGDGGAAIGSDLVAELEEGGFLAGNPASSTAGTGRRGVRSRLALPRALATLEVRTTNADRITRLVYRRGGRLLFHPIAVVGQVVLAVAGVIAVLHALFSPQPLRLAVHPDQVPLVIGLGCLSIVVHEMAHALVVVHGGGRVDAAGVRLLLGTPAFFVESIDAQLLSRRMRLLQAGAGAWIEWLLTSLAAIWLWSGALGPITATLLCRFVLLNTANVLSNLLPFVKLDGHWLLADAVGQPDLGERAGGAVRRLVSDTVLRRPQTRSGRLLAGYSAINAVVAVGLLTFSVFVWYELFAGLLRTLIRDGVWGWAVLAVFAVLVGRPAVTAGGTRLRSAVTGLREIASAWKFRREFAWRIAATEALMAARPALTELGERGLGVLAGQWVLVDLASPAPAPHFFTTMVAARRRMMRACICLPESAGTRPANNR